MTSPVDDENPDELEAGSQEQGKSGDEGKEGEEGKGKGKAGSAGGKKGKAGDTGEGDSDSFGRGKAGAGAGVVKLSTEKNKQVWADFKHYDINSVVDAIVEFFSEFPARASAHIKVVIEKSVNLANKAPWAIVNNFFAGGKEILRQQLALRRERGMGGNMGGGRAGGSGSRRLTTTTGKKAPIEQRNRKQEATKPKAPTASMNVTPKGPGPTGAN